MSESRVGLTAGCSGCDRSPREVACAISDSCGVDHRVGLWKRLRQREWLTRRYGRRSQRGRGHGESGAFAAHFTDPIYEEVSDDTIDAEDKQATVAALDQLMCLAMFGESNPSLIR